MANKDRNQETRPRALGACEGLGNFPVWPVDETDGFFRFRSAIDPAERDSGIVEWFDERVATKDLGGKLLSNLHKQTQARKRHARPSETEPLKREEQELREALMRAWKKPGYVMYFEPESASSRRRKQHILIYDLERGEDPQFELQPYLTRDDFSGRDSRFFQLMPFQSRKDPHVHLHIVKVGTGGTFFFVKRDADGIRYADEVHFAQRREPVTTSYIRAEDSEKLVAAAAKAAAKKTTKKEAPAEKLTSADLGRKKLSEIVPKGTFTDEEWIAIERTISAAPTVKKFLDGAAKLDAIAGRGKPIRKTALTAARKAITAATAKK